MKVIKLGITSGANLRIPLSRSLIAKLRAYGFGHESLKFIYSYLKERKQRTKVGCSFSTWKMIKYGAPQGPILGPLLFNIFLNDIFYFINNTQITNYADDNTTYSMAKYVHNLLAILKDDNKFNIPLSYLWIIARAPWAF